MITQMVKDCIDKLLPAISSMVDLIPSLKVTSLPSGRRLARLMRPKLKKPGIDLVKKNYRPVRNPVFLFKITEKVSAQQTSQHMSVCQLYPDFQSAYCQHHSMETALLRMRNDILLNMNKQHVTLLVFLDLSCAPRASRTKVRHLWRRVGLVRSYLTERSHCILIKDAKSASFDLKFGVTQGSCLGLLLFSIYTSELFTIISHTTCLRHTVMRMILSYILHFNLMTVLPKTLQ